MTRNRSIGAIFALLVGLGPQVCSAQAADATFPSAEEAGRALYQAVRDDDEAALTGMLGADNEFVSAEDPAEDKRDREQFVRKYQQMHRLVRQSDGATVLYIGAENWPFPFPLVEQDAAWRFDAKVGMEEVLARRIGDNELAAIATGRALATHAPDGRSQAAAQLLVNVGNDGRTVPFHGYYFRRLPGQQELVAYPAEYQSTGVMTFLIGKDDVVYEKDLGADTAELATNISKVDSTSSWHRVADLRQ